MRSLYDVREAAFVGAWLQCAAHIRNYHGADIPRFDMGWEPGGAVVYGFHRSFQAALAALDAQLGGQRSFCTAWLRAYRRAATGASQGAEVLVAHGAGAE
eukprot:gene5713-biopygen8792